MKRISLFLIGLMAFGSLVLASDVSVTAGVNRSQLSVGETLTYSISIEGSGAVSEPVLPDLSKSFSIVSRQTSQSFSIINGAVTSQISKQYLLSPIAEGTFEIPPSSVTVAGQTYKTNAISITVTGSNSTAQPGQQSGNVVAQSSGPARSDYVYLDLSVSKTDVYVGEQVVLTLKRFQRKNLQSFQGEQPEFKGFLAESLPVKSGYDIEQFGRLSYYVQEMGKWSLFPVKAGAIEIAPIKASYRVSPFDPFRDIQTDSIKLNVKDLPGKGKPRNFTGVVGELSLADSIDKTSLNQGDPITLTLTLSGEGNLTAINDLSIQEDSRFRVYQSQVKDELDKSQGLGGKRIFEYILIPKVSGDLTLPELSFSYFSPSDKSYHTLKSTPRRVQVKAVAAADSSDSSAQGTDAVHKQTIEVIQEDILFIKTPLKFSESSLVLFRHPFLSILIVLNLVFGLRLFWHSFRGAFLRGGFGNKRHKLIAKTHNILVGLAKNDVVDSKVLVKVENVFLDFLTQYLGISARNLPSEDLKKALLDKELDEAVVFQIAELLDVLSYAAYSPYSDERQAEHKELVNRVLACVNGAKDWRYSQ